VLFGVIECDLKEWHSINGIYVGHSWSIAKEAWGDSRVTVGHGLTFETATAIRDSARFGS
jgi:hypothetical protein